MQKKYLLQWKKAHVCAEPEFQNGLPNSSAVSYWSGCDEDQYIVGILSYRIFRDAKR